MKELYFKEEFIMNEKFDKVMSKVGLFLGGVVVTMIGMTVMGTIMNNKDHQIEDEKIFKTLERVVDSQE
jgi:signal transduction histidine kinase